MEIIAAKILKKNISTPTINPLLDTQFKKVIKTDKAVPNKRIIVTIL